MDPAAPVCVVVGSWSPGDDTARALEGVSMAVVRVDTIAMLGELDLTNVELVIVDEQDVADQPSREALGRLTEAMPGRVLLVGGDDDAGGRGLPGGGPPPMPRGGPRLRSVTRGTAETAMRRMPEAATRRAPPGTEAAGAEAPEGAGPAPEQLYWNTRFPGNEAVLEPGGAQAGIVLAGRAYDFETALDTEPGAGIATPAGDAADFAGAEPVFEVQGTGVELSTDGETWAARAQSPPMACGTEGTDPFTLQLRVPQAGPATIDLRLVVRNEVQLSQHLELVAVAVPGAPPSRSPRLPEAAPEIDGQGLRSAGQAMVRVTVTLDDGTPSLGVDGDGIRVPAVDAANGDDAIANGAAALRVELVKLAGRYPAEPGPRGEFDLGGHEDEVRLTFARVGARLHDLVFGSPAADNPLTALRADAARWISTVGRDGEATLQVADDAIVLPVPWGLLYDAGAYAAALGEQGQAVPPNLRPRPEAADQVDERCFWGRRFALSRFFPLPALSRPVLGGPDGVRVTPVLNCQLGEPVVTNQRSLFAGGGGGAGGGTATLVADDVIADPAALVAWAEAGDTRPSDLLYFFCHARSVAQFGPTGFPTGAADPGDAALGLAADDTGETVTVARLREAWNRRRERRPLVLLNACGSTQADAVYGVPFVQAFMGTWQARALVGTDWTIPTRFADPFSRRVVEGLRRGLTVAAALRAASLEAFAQGNLYPLMYALYGQPSVALVEAMP